MNHRTFIAIILGTTMTVTGFAAPARADSDEIVQVLAGAAALAIASAAIERERRRSRDVSRDDPWLNANRLIDPFVANTRRLGANKEDRFALPAKCRRREATARGDIRGFGRRCLARNYAYFNELPRRCAVRLRDYGGRNGVIFHRGCLRQNGFSTASDGRR